MVLCNCCIAAAAAKRRIPPVPEPLSTLSEYEPPKIPDIPPKSPQRLKSREHSLLLERANPHVDTISQRGSLPPPQRSSPQVPQVPPVPRHYQQLSRSQLSRSASIHSRGRPRERSETRGRSSLRLDTGSQPASASSSSSSSSRRSVSSASTATTSSCWSQTSVSQESHSRRNSCSSKMSIPPQLQQQLRLLIRANHILHHHGLVDAFGHISVRHPLNKDQYIIAAYDPGAPALVKNVSDFNSYWVHDSTPVDKDAPQGYSERFIHGEILRKFPDANCVVHSHSEDVIPFTLGRGTRAPHPVRAVFHMAGFLGQAGATVFDMERLYGTGRAPTERDLLIKNAVLGEALASHLKMESPVVLQHKHGFTTFGASIEEAVYRAIYTQKNCILLQRAIAIAGGHIENVDFLSPEEIKDCAIMNKKTLDKSFRLWLREVQVNRLYQNEEGEPEKVKVSGMKV